MDFSSNAIASKARLHLHHTPFGDSVMNCFFGQPPLINKNTQQFLQIPPPVRQFLISPPASPPVDWAPALETEPVINFDLLSALASLGPGLYYYNKFVIPISLFCFFCPLSRRQARTPSGIGQ